MQMNQCNRHHPGEFDGVAVIESREAAKAQRDQDLPHYLRAFADSRELLSTGDTKNRVPAFAGMTDELGHFA
ncbi:hypothetical protein CHN51_04745 [Sphingorhabdus sp. YGSMI21]|nr:hypothetical protein CHN51_04745 [Sphingorhabdus sp. YGSMI21]